MVVAARGRIYQIIIIIIATLTLLFAMLHLLNVSEAKEARAIATERHKWCKEYHPSLTIEECSKEAGW